MGCGNSKAKGSETGTGTLKAGQIEKRDNKPETAAAKANTTAPQNATDKQSFISSPTKSPYGQPEEELYCDETEFMGLPGEIGYAIS